jgi:hypothetical protein
MNLDDSTSMKQASLFREPPSIQEAFEKFHQEHPEVYDTLVRFAREWQRSGRQNCGIKMLWERVRWELSLGSTDEDEFKMNNNFHSRYVRLICKQEPELAGMFELRKLKAS